MKSIDRGGCYSGSAVDDNGRLTLCYTGNVKFDDGTRTAWQCLAVQNADGGFDKLGPVMPLPGGYTGHVRDPKVWRHGEHWYMVLGAQDLELQGKVLLLPLRQSVELGKPGRDRRQHARRAWRVGLHVGVPGPFHAGRQSDSDRLPARA
ncbi:Sucrose-6-phosphate hydrolase [Cronobacter sakazakii]|nr:Sucrose-6-phosphate hydrolase [Cronobacter sakazakii]